MGWYADYARWMYRSRRPNPWARWQNRASAAVYAAGVWPRRAATLEVRGRTSGRIISLPVVIAEYGGNRYLVSMLGDDVNWVRNVRAANGEAVLRHGRTEQVRLTEVPAGDRGPIVRNYLDVAPGARPHMAVDRNSPPEAFEKIARTIPVFLITPRSSSAAA